MAQGTLPWLDPTKREIRLIRILPSDYSRQPIRLRMLRAKLPSSPLPFPNVPLLQPSYIALSYTWGKATPRYSVLIIDEYDKLCTVSVRENLHNFLVSARRQVILEARLYTWYWIDQISINQSDDFERSQQVRMMAQIYTAAEQVLVWIPVGSEQVSDAAQLVEDIKIRASASRSGVTARTHYIPEIDTCARNPAMQSILGSEYWTRLWIVQELQLARILTFQFGNSHCSGEDFEHLLYEMKEHLSWQQRSTRNQFSGLQARTVFALASRRSAQGFSSWKEVANLASGLHCSDFHDKVYAFLGLVSIDMRIAPDYSLPPLALHRMVMAHSQVDLHANHGSDLKRIVRDNADLWRIWAAILGASEVATGSLFSEYLQVLLRDRGYSSEEVRLAEQSL